MDADDEKSAPRHKLNTKDAKAKVLDLVRAGKTVTFGMQAVGRTYKSYEYWRKTDKQFVANIDAAREYNREKEAGFNYTPAENCDFESFTRQYLHTPAFWHQLQWIDLLEGRQPRDLHPSEIYWPGREELLICNTPPEHGKSTTITVNYVTYRICMDPNVRIIIVSKTKEMAKRFLYAVQYRMTHPNYREMQLRFAPQDGFRAGSDQWTKDQIYLGSEQRDSGEKDPTILALGIGGQVYGARADLIIVDDAVTLSNAGEFEKQIDWLSQEVLTRLSDTGKLLIVGTRVAALDLYSQLLDPNRWPDGECEYTYLAQPAVLEFAEDPKNWRTLWPEMQHKAGHLVPKWDGVALDRRRRVLQTRTWAMVYMQQQVAEDAVFPAEQVNNCINQQRVTGPLIVGAKGHPEGGMEGLYVVAGLDPAAVGHTGAVVMAVNRYTQKRYVLDISNVEAMTPMRMRELIRHWTEHFGVHEWRIENNAFQGYLVNDEEIRSFLNARGCKLMPHHTGTNKLDPELGVSSMQTLFVGEKPLIELPSTKQVEATRQLVEQLVTWQPKTKGKTDIVMALWFCELAAREVCMSARNGARHIRNPYLTKAGQLARGSLNLDELAARHYQMAEAGL